jgi:hypothetical protein
MLLKLLFYKPFVNRIKYLFLLNLTKIKKLLKYGIRLFAILDDIAALMDDVAVTSKVATQKQQVFWEMIWL